MATTSEAITTTEERPAWTPERTKLIRDQICPQGISEPELAHFADWCRRSGLDPLRGDCLLQERWMNLEKDRNKPKRMVRRLTPMATEAGMARRAAEFPTFEGIRCAPFYEGDSVEYDHTNGTVKHTSNPLRRGRLIGAWAVVQRRGFHFPIEECLLADFDQGTATWQTMKPTMITKCARAAAFRRAFPSDFGSVYSVEESRFALTLDEGAEISTPSAPATALDVAKARVAATMARTAPAMPPSTPAPALPPGETSVSAALGNARPEAFAEPPPVEAEHLPPPESAPPPRQREPGDDDDEPLPSGPPEPPPENEPPPGVGDEIPDDPPPARASPPKSDAAPVPILFGKHKGTDARTLSVAALLEVITEGNAKAAQSTGKERWAKSLADNLTALRKLHASKV